MASNIEVASYDPKKVNLVMNGKIITGFASDSMITIARNEDTVTTQVGVKGDVAYNENANESGTITVTLMGTSSSLPYVRSLALKRKEVSVMIIVKLWPERTGRSVQKVYLKGATENIWLRLRKSLLVSRNSPSRAFRPRGTTTSTMSAAIPAAVSARAQSTWTACSRTASWLPLRSRQRAWSSLTTTKT